MNARLFPALLLALALFIALTSAPARGFGFFNATGNGLLGGSRWDASPRTMTGNWERSLSGGLRFSLQGGTYAAYRNLLTWQGTPPSVADFEQAVLDAFAVWTSTDPATGLDSNIRFVPDLGTPVSTVVTNNIRTGAEIDILVATDASGWNPGDNGTRAETFFNSISVPGNLMLTTGVTNYAGFAISGADITFNSNPGAQYTLDTFRVILTHEIGHALGLADVDFTSGPAGTFIDDNYSGTNNGTILATLTNSFALLINPANPGASPLQLYTVPNANPGIDTPGVDILMESNIPSIFFQGGDTYLSPDDVAGRQFLYPVALAPKLAIALDGADVVLTWPEALGWRAARSSTLATPASWTLVSTASTLQGNTRTLRLPRSVAREFYRLERFAP